MADGQMPPDDDLKQDGVNPIAPYGFTRKLKTGMDATCTATNVAGLWNASLPGSSGNDGSSLARIIAPPIF